LEEVFEAAEAGTEYIITRYRDPNANLRTQLLRIIDRAGVQPWPKLFHNLRASRETELAQEHPLHVVCAWIGNSQQIAAKHYLQVTDDHFEQALKPGPEAAQNPAQYAHELSRKGPYKKQQTPVFPEEYEGLLTCTAVQAPPGGVEPPFSD
jgi:hypothetical protein